MSATDDGIRCLADAISDVAPIRSLITNRMNLNLQAVTARESEDIFPEVLIMGEVCFGMGFPSARFGLACTWHFQWDEPWVLLEAIASAIQI
mmetsp:Transcript_23316/g.80161  ORF Transcript_23316/g.80161 Transcript_23316/m.80161 type:complete len:92 (+) Transcript_23316:56-331(+)